jgi:hypothetical protein
MPTRLYIFGNAGLWPGRDGLHGPWDLRGAVNRFVQGSGEVTWDGDYHIGPGWSVDLLLYDDDIDSWVQKLATFMRDWGVPDNPISFTISSESRDGEIVIRKVEIPGR